MDFRFIKLIKLSQNGFHQQFIIFLSFLCMSLLSLLNHFQVTEIKVELFFLFILSLSVNVFTPQNITITLILHIYYNP